jgi:PleD family two-component response regulator
VRTGPVSGIITAPRLQAASRDGFAAPPESRRRRPWSGHAGPRSALSNTPTVQEVTMLKKVLVIDDSALIHQMYKMVLMRYRCEIINALNGQEGLDKLERHPDVDMMLVDINMPMMNGLEFIQKVKASISAHGGMSRSPFSRATCTP